MRKITHIFILLLVIAGLSACDSDSGGALSCTIPCIDATPTVDTTSVSSSTGGTVTVDFHLNGTISDVAAVTILLKSTDPTSANTIGGLLDGIILSPSANNISATFTVSAGATAGTYFPNISVTTTSGDGGQYYIDPTKSSSAYTYAEVTGSSAGTPQLSSFTIPTITVQ